MSDRSDVLLRRYEDAKWRRFLYNERRFPSRCSYDNHDYPCADASIEREIGETLRAWKETLAPFWPVKRGD